MKMLGKSRGVAAVIAAAIGLAVAPAYAQMSPTGLAPTTPPPPATAKPAPAAPATTPAAKPAGTTAAPTTPTTPATKPAAAAPAKPADPKALVASGDKKLKAGDHAGALADYEAANAAKASPEADLGIARSHDKLGHLPEAAAAYDRFLASSPKNKADADEAKKRSDEIKAMPGKLHIESTPAGATILVDPQSNPSAQAAGSTPADIELPAGKHTLRLQAEGFEPMDKEVDVAAAAKQDVRAELVKKPEPPAPPPPPPVVAEQAQPASTPPPPPPPEPRSKVPAYVTGAVAIIAAGVGTGFGIKALSQSSDFDKAPTTEKADDGENNALVADMMFGIAITFGVTSAVLFLSSDAPQSAKNKAPKSAPVVAKKPANKVTIIPAPYVTPTGGGAGAVVKF